MTWMFRMDLAKLPVVLAGPILRKVTETSVTVWFALKERATITLTVSDATGEILTGSGDTIALGRNLHILAVTANRVMNARTPLKGGVTYFYDAVLDVRPDGEGPANRISLRAATELPGSDLTRPWALCYGLDTRPSFALPPPDIANLRLMHGSCRKMHGEGPDALALLDQLIDESLRTPELRPHQLILTGDQIYADEVAPHLQKMITFTAAALLGWEEEMPLRGGGATGKQLPPYTRRDVTQLAGFTSIANHCHVLTLGEYLCSYLFAWSDVPWKICPLPTERDMRELVDDLMGGKADLISKIDDLFTKERNSIRKTMRMYLHQDIFWTSEFEKTISSVRRILANIPTYMIFDDHEACDDFNMTRRICEDNYGSPLGLQIIQNGLVAYSLCQHWGNAPEQFEGATTPGRKLLNALNNSTVASYESRQAEIRRYVGVHTAAEMRAPPAAIVGADQATTFAAYHDNDSLTYNYTIEAPTHQVIVADTRTWRAHPEGRDAAGVLMPAHQLEKQIARVSPPTAGRLLVVVLPTNAPSLPVIRFAPQDPVLANAVKADDQVDLYESWEVDTESYGRLLNAITDRVQAMDGKITGSAIILSGDVHSTSASRIRYNGDRRFGFSANQAGAKVDFVIAQLIGSSLKNRMPNTITQHKNGFSFPLMDRSLSEGHYGWNVNSVSGVSVARGFLINTATQLEGAIGGGSPMQTSLVVRKPTIAPRKPLGIFRFSDVLTLTDLLVKPDFQLRLDYIRANREGPLAQTYERVPAVFPGQTAADRSAAIAQFNRITDNYRRYDGDKNASREIIGLTNLCEMTVDPARQVVNHVVRWMDTEARSPTLQLTKFVVSLNPADPKYDIGKIMLPIRQAS